jgi:malonyl-CoA/methylmalonyl-CoA synthetase
MPFPGIQARVVGEDGLTALAQGEVGDIQVIGPNVMLGYWRMPEKTKEEFTADGWFKTGDVGMIDADGYLNIVGRAKDMIISGGYNVYPKEIEGVIDDLPGVDESGGWCPPPRFWRSRPSLCGQGQQDPHRRGCDH